MSRNLHSCIPKKKPKPLCFVLIPAEALNALNEPKSKKPNMQYTPELIPN